MVTSFTAEPVAVITNTSLPFVSSIDVIKRGRVARRFPDPAVTLVPSDVKPEMPPNDPAALYCTCVDDPPGEPPPPPLMVIVQVLPVQLSVPFVTLISVGLLTRGLPSTS